ncbi:MAG TPA: DUF4255 domain-containing protein [Pyrinomonadaceae bacterium]|nr:DUF4255 domain-containing protein [Pyrinomonadaceae bacterium]
MSGDAIKLVTEALRSRLETALTRSTIPGTVFVGPLDDADASGAALVLFLYRIVPNAHLRNREHTIVTSTPPPIIFRNSLPLDLYYLISVGTIPGSSEETFLTALGFAMQEFQMNPELTGPTINNQAVHVSIEPLTTEESSRIWALFPTANYRTSVAYLVTPVWIDPDRPEIVAGPVVEDQLHAGPPDSGVVS